MVRGGIRMEACHNQKKNLVLYAYGEMDPNSGKKIENHLARCKNCRSEYQQLVSLLGNIKKEVASPELSPKQVNSLVTNIKYELNNRKKEKGWRQYLDFKPVHMVPAIATACILVITAVIIGYVKNSDTNAVRSVAVQQNEELMLSETDLEVVKNLDFLKELDAIEKLSQVVDLNREINPQGDLDNEKRGMRQDAYRQYFV